MNHLEDLEELARIKAISGPNTYKWSSWESPVGLIIFFNGLALCAILVRYVFLMK